MLSSSKCGTATAIHGGGRTVTHSGSAALTVASTTAPPVVDATVAAAVTAVTAASPLLYHPPSPHPYRDGKRGNGENPSSSSSSSVGYVGYGDRSWQQRADGVVVRQRGAWRSQIARNTRRGINRPANCAGVGLGQQYPPPAHQEGGRGGLLVAHVSVPDVLKTFSRSIASRAPSRAPSRDPGSDMPCT